MSNFVIENGVLTTYTPKCPCEDVIVPEGVVAIANNVFCGTDIRSIRLPGSLTKVGEGWRGTSFENCEKLETICIEDGQAYIEGLRFQGCSLLKNVQLPNTLTTLSVWMFKGCTSLQNITLPESLTGITRDAFTGCTALKEIHIPNGVLSIDKGAFAKCTALERVFLGKKIVSIRHTAFEKCESFTEFVVDEENEAFSTLDGLLCSKDGTKLECVPSGVKGLFTVPHGITDVGSSAFSDCIFMEGISFAETVTYISNGAFDDCTSLVHVDIPATVTEIHSAFGKFSSSYNRKPFETIRVSLQAGAVTNNPNFWFPAGKTPIVHPELPISCISDKDDKKRAAIGFCLNTQLYSEDYARDYLAYVKKQRNNILKYVNDQKIREDIEAFYAALDAQPAAKKQKVSKASAKPVSESGAKMTVAELKKIWTYTKGGYDKSITGTETITGVVIKKYKGTEENVQIPAYIGNSPVVGIEPFAFSENNTMTAVTVPETVFGIEDSAFAECKNLKCVTIQSSALHMGSHVFSRCENLQEFNIHAGTIKNAIHPFWGCTKLMDENGFIILGNGDCKVLCDYLNPNRVSNVIVPEGITHIGGYAFAARHHYYDARDNGISDLLEQVTLPSTLKEIGKNAFADVQNLTEIRIPEGVHTIEQMAFIKCKKLLHYYLPASLTTIGAAAIFKKSAEVTIHAPVGSYAEQFAKKNNIPFEAI